MRRRLVELHLSGPRGVSRTPGRLRAQADTEVVAAELLDRIVAKDGLELMFGRESEQNHAENCQVEFSRGVQ